MSVYVHKDHLGKKIGRGLYAKLLSILQEKGFRSAIGITTIPNEASGKLHQSFGFKKCAEFRDAGFKFNQWHSNEHWQLMLEEFLIPK